MEKLKLHCIYHGENTEPKSDAFLIEYGEKLILVDGGLENSGAFDYLMKIRQKRIDEYGFNDSYRLPFSQVISHFHRDHVDCIIDNIIPCPLFEITDIWLPPDPDIDPYYNNEGTDRDEIYRPLMKETLDKYYPELKVNNIPFGKSIIEIFGRDDVSVEILPPVADSAFGERFENILSVYNNKRSKYIAISVTNSSSIWVLAKKGAKSFLLTGDTTKRKDELYETFDEMIDNYGEYIGRPNLLKYTHHGVNRDNALRAHLALKPDYLLLTSEISTVPEAFENSGLELDGEIVNCGLKDIIFETDGETITKNE